MRHLHMKIGLKGTAMILVVAAALTAVSYTFGPTSVRTALDDVTYFMSHNTSHPPTDSP